MSKNVTKCPHCGSDEGIYTKATYINIPCSMNYDGTEMDNSEMYDNAEGYKFGKNAYCLACGKIVCRLKKLEEQWGRDHARA